VDFIVQVKVWKNSFEIIMKTPYVRCFATSDDFCSGPFLFCYPVHQWSGKAESCF